MIRLLLIDDHAIVREGFKRLFDGVEDMAVVAEAANAEAALAAVRSTQPDIAVIDLNLGAGGSGLALIPRLAAAAPQARLVVLSMHDDPALVLRAIDGGAHGFVTKAVAHEELPALLRRAGQGEVVLSSDLATPALHAKPAPQLTQRERETLRGLLSDRPPKAVAADRGIRDTPLYRHRANLRETLGARTQGDLVRIARERGLLLDG